MRLSVLWVLFAVFGGLPAGGARAAEFFSVDVTGNNLVVVSSDRGDELGTDQVDVPVALSAGPGAR